MGNRNFPDRKVIVVEDDEDSKIFMMQYLGITFDVVGSSTAEEALELLPQFKPQVIISDMRLAGDMSGLDLLREVKKNFPEVMVIIVTAFANKEFAIDAIRAGAFDFIEKPIEMDMLGSSLDKAWKFVCLEHARKQAEARALASEARYKALFDAIVDGVVIVDVENKKFEFSNPTFCKLAGYSSEEILNIKLGDLCADEYLKDFLESDDLSEKFKNSNAMESTLIRKDGTKRRIEINVSFSELDGKPFLLAIVRDITDRLENERRVFQAEKLAALGTLSAGVAHELNNPLAGILGLAHIIGIKCNDSEIVKDRAEQIYNAGQKMRKIIDNLRQIPRQISFDDYSEFELKDCINDSTTMFKKKLAMLNINFSTDFPSSLPMLKGDQVKIVTVFRNLLINSIDAFISGGENLSREISIRAKEASNGIAILYEDNAGGISDDIKQHIFDPFFTTKDVGKGTGLGLYLVHDIIKKHRGKIRYSNQDGGKAQFEFFFPIVKSS